MKTLKKHTALFILFTALLVSSCEFRDNNQLTNNGILPERFKVEIPSSMSNETATTASGLKAATGTNTDTLNGNAIYLNLATFIAVGDGASDIVVAIMAAIAIYDIDEPMSISFESNDDHRIKNLVVEENAEYEGRSFEYMLTITDALSEPNEDGGKALQVFWNRRPIEGIAILKPYNINRDENPDATDALISIEYTEVETSTYDARMIVEIANLPLPDSRYHPFAMNNLKMFVGRKDNYVDVYGNSNHPNARFFTEDTGFSWSFVASGDDDANIAVAEVGLPPSGLNESNRMVLLEDYSIKNVFTNEINRWFMEIWGIHPDSADLAVYLQNADAPGYFDHDGFIQGGTAPSGEYGTVETRIETLAPYNPYEINNLSIEFK